MKELSKSKLMIYRQCAKRLWLELHRPEFRQDSAATRASFHNGHRVGAVAQRLYDPRGEGAVIDLQREGLSAAVERTQALLAARQPVFEAGFRAHGALAFADVMLPSGSDTQPAWRMVEVKSTTAVKDYFLDDAAVQAFVARGSGVRLEAVALAHIDRNWVYQGEGDYRGLLVEKDVSESAFGRAHEVQSWVGGAQAVASLPAEPQMLTGEHCAEPYECGFIDHCAKQEPEAEHPVRWLPRVQGKRLRTWIGQNPFADLRDVPDDLLNDLQRRVKDCTLSRSTWFDAQGAAAALAVHRPPAYFVDFETIQFAVPIWRGTRPYQQIPFQFSVHRLSRENTLDACAFLDLSGDDPSEAFGRALIAACGDAGPVFVYNAAFESSRIRELAERFAALRPALLAIEARVVDLRPIAERHFYHPSQEGSWSIKKLLPAIAPDLKYGALEGVQNGAMAMDAYLEAIAHGTSPARRIDIDRQLRAYCNLDTYAMVRLWQFLSGRGGSIAR